MVEQKPNVKTFNEILSAFTTKQSIKEASNIIHHMTQFQVTLNVSTYNALMHMYGKRGQTNEMLQVFDQLINECKPNTGNIG
jgi:pentatricopeptide repeat protein